MALNLSVKTLAQQYKEEIHNKLDEIDPDDTEDWRSIRSMAIGWAIGKGVSIESARIFASYVSSCSLD